jgi:hypothetical protein
VGRAVRVITLWACSAVLFGAAVVPAGAQPAQQPPSVDVSIGYQLLHLPGETFPAGWNVDVSGAMHDVLRIVGEFGMSRDEQTEFGVSGTLKYYHLGVGPRLASHAGSARPFVQLLGGVVHTRADLVLANVGAFHDGDWAFMLQPGGGVAIPLGDVVSVIGQADYRRVFFKEQGDNEFRVAFAVRLGFR